MRSIPNAIFRVVESADYTFRRRFSGGHASRLFRIPRGPSACLQEGRQEASCKPFSGGLLKILNKPFAWGFSPHANRFCRRAWGGRLLQTVYSGFTGRRGGLLIFLMWSVFRSFHDILKVPRNEIQEGAGVSCEPFIQDPHDPVEASRFSSCETSPGGFRDILKVPRKPFFRRGGASRANRLFRIPRTKWKTHDFLLGNVFGMFPG